MPHPADVPLRTDGYGVPAIVVSRRPARFLCAVPLDRFLEALVERRGRMEPERLARAIGIQLAAGLSVRLAHVPDDPSGESTERRDSFDQILDADFRAGP